MAGFSVGSIPETMLGNSSEPTIPQAMSSAVAAGGRRTRRCGSQYDTSRLAPKATSRMW